MPNKIAHFAIEADDVERARNFYETVFGWTFKAWGPPDFYMIEGAGIGGALQKRRELLADGTRGFECTIAVDDLSHTISAIKNANGQIVSDRFMIPNVGELVSFIDTEGNRAIVMCYVSGGHT